jgi:hypothetical protein
MVICPEGTVKPKIFSSESMITRAGNGGTSISLFTSSQKAQQPLAKRALAALVVHSEAHTWEFNNLEGRA